MLTTFCCLFPLIRGKVGERSRMRMGDRDKKIRSMSFFIAFQQLVLFLTLPSIVIFYKQVFILTFSHLICKIAF